MPSTIAVVFEPDFSARLPTLCFHTPVWLADTPENREAAEDAWRQMVEWPHISVTMFRPHTDWAELLGLVTLQQRGDTIDVIGAPLTADAQNALAGAGFVHVDATPQGFRASRRKRG
ncbi:MAG TPA: hypothetical protein VF618_22570 [Thermoanaerobaculia bacterium]